MRGGETRHHSLGSVLRTIGCQAQLKRLYGGFAQRHARGTAPAAKRYCDRLFTLSLRPQGPGAHADLKRVRTASWARQGRRPCALLSLRPD